MQSGLNLAVTLIAAFAVCAVATFGLSLAANKLNLIDRPGGRKTHLLPIPLVGGLGIFLAVLIVASLIGLTSSAGYFVFALSVVIAVGMWDDVREIAPRLKFLIQVGASAIMIWGADVQLTSVGDLLGWKPIGLWIFSAPLTIFSIVGVVNALNMIDGFDGLSGSIALVAFGWYAAVSATSSLPVQLSLALIFCGAIAAFLLFNLRFPWQQRARVFLGDAGSLMIGFALGWFAIDLTQGPQRSFPPIAALWVVVLPLADCVSLMLRRVLAGRNPFVADSRHIHHYLIALGLSYRRTLCILVGLSVLFGAVGYFGWVFGVPESWLFWPFCIGFFVYHAWIIKAWAALEVRGRLANSSLGQRDEVARAS
jgi:UDP-GlcNAc:undecaprenyl-phosphate GlcNAc-1-phosphate transferase